MLTRGQLIVLFRVRLLGRVSFWPRRLVRSSAELTIGEISLAFGHAMKVHMSHWLQSGVPPFTPHKACLLLVMFGVFIALLTRNCNITGLLGNFRVFLPQVSFFSFSNIFCCSCLLLLRAYFQCKNSHEKGKFCCKFLAQISKHFRAYFTFDCNDSKMTMIWVPLKRYFPPVEPEWKWW